MIRGEYCIIRNADPDDAVEMSRLYDPRRPRAMLLDRRHEPLLLSADELYEALSLKDKNILAYLVVEDISGHVRGFCALRPSAPELAYGELAFMLLDDADHDTPLAREAYQYLQRTAFVEKKLNKLVTHCLDTEGAFREFVIEMGFKTDGIQREILYSGGSWRGVETLSLFREAIQEIGHADHQ